MSCYVVEDTEIDYLVSALTRLKIIPSVGLTADQLGQALKNQNLASFAHRHRGTFFPESDYRYKSHPDHPKRVYASEKAAIQNTARLFRCIDHYSYQACETPDWLECDVAGWLERLKDKALMRISTFAHTYENTSWGDVLKQVND